MKVLRTLLLISIGFLPSLLSLWVICITKKRTRARTRQIALNYSQMQPPITPVESDRYYLEGVGYLVGDISCQFNARSGYIRCAVNPSGPCKDCHYYEPKELGITAFSELKIEN